MNGIPSSDRECRRGWPKDVGQLFIFERVSVIRKNFPGILSTFHLSQMNQGGVVITRNFRILTIAALTRNRWRGRRNDDIGDKGDFSGPRKFVFLSHYSSIWPQPSNIPYY